MLSSQVIANRALSAFPVSVGTSLALESIFVSDQPSIDPDRKIPQYVDYHSYDEFWINVSTLFRNLMGSLGKDGASAVTAPDIRDALINEIAYIDELVEHSTDKKMQTIFYVCEYKKIEEMENKYITTRKDVTDNQKIYRALHNQSIQGVIQAIGKGDNFRVYNSDLNVAPKDKPGFVPKRPKALILTHIPWDLTSHHRFGSLDLIESHSGVLKKRATWYTKYLNGKDLPQIPFMRALLPIFGDREHFSPVAIGLRKELLEISKSNNWNQLTTVAKIKANLGQLKNKYAAEVLGSIIQG